MRSSRAAFVVAGLSLAASGCGAAASALGPTPAVARSHADALLGAIEARFGPVEREPAYAAARPLLVRGALVPSRIFDEPTVWTTRQGEERGLDLGGSESGGRYRLGLRPDYPEPSRPADYRGRVRLRRLGDGRFEWRVREELAVGPVRAEALAAALTTLLRGAESATEAKARVQLGEALPRSRAALGRLFRLETLHFAPAPPGGTVVTLRVRLHPEGIDKELPHYAEFLKGYVTPLRLRMDAADEAGIGFWEVEGLDNLFSLRFRVQDGDLAPLAGPPRSLPERLRVRTSFSMKSGLFRLGYRGLDADVTLVRSLHEKSFMARFRRQPDWELPFFVEPFLRSPLRYPFEGEGARLGFGVRDEPEGSTLLAAEHAIGVQENWLVRWLGGVGASAVTAFRRTAEAEADRFIGEALAALRADALALLSSSAPVDHPPQPEGGVEH